MKNFISDHWIWIICVLAVIIVALVVVVIVMDRKDNNLIKEYKAKEKQLRQVKTDRQFFLFFCKLL